MRTSRALAALLTMVAFAGGRATADEPADAVCAGESRILPGADARVAAGPVAFRPEWTPTLERIAACLRDGPLRDACIAVVGHADGTEFGEAFVRAFGSSEAAQLARAHGRASAVVARLVALGVPSERVREHEPVLGSGTRGVELRTVRGCPAAAPSPSEEGEARLVERTVSLAVARLDARAAEERDREARARAEEEGARRQAALAQRGRFWVDAALDGTLLGFDPSTVLGVELQLGGGWRRGPLSLRAGLGVGLASEEAQRWGLVASASAAWRLARWVDLGLEARYRIAAQSASQRWLEQSLAVGVQATHCPWTAGALGGLEICISEAILPIGVRVRRAEVDRGELVSIPQESSWAVELRAGVVVRHPF